MPSKFCVINFLGELNDFLPRSKRNKALGHGFMGKPSVKDVVESLGIPHTEIGILKFNGKLSKLSRHVKHQDRIEVHPGLKYPRTLRFILDVHLGKLAKRLRLLGSDVLYQNNYKDPEIVDIGVLHNRVILTRDRDLLKNKRIRYGYWVRQTDPQKQLVEIAGRFSMRRTLRPFSVCVECNGKIKRISKTKVQHRLHPKTRLYYKTFYRCEGCHHIYWKGSHYERILQFIKPLLS